jgi:RecQ family ATP-dependent DNA helicase
MYHAGLTSEERESTQEKFISNEYKIIVATVAFGMGINKSNVRTVIHYGCPSCLESYYQEIGRAGRDGKPSECYLYYSMQDFKIQEMFIDKINTNKSMEYKKIKTQMLGTMMDFTSTDKCRKRVIMEYFGDNSMTENCGKCDNCEPRKNKTTISIKDNEMIKNNGDEMYVLLNVIKDVNCGLGLNNIIKIIRGSNAKTLDERYRNNKFYKSRNQIKESWWKDIYGILKDRGYIDMFSINSSIRVPKITTKGIEFINSHDFKNKPSLQINKDLFN